MPQHEYYTIEDIYHLPKETRAELIDGQIYYMTLPTRTHQKLLFAISCTIADYIDSKKGNCEVDIAPFAVFLNEDNQNYVEPDISVICDTEKLSEKAAPVLQTGSLRLFHPAVGKWTILPNFSNIALQAFENTGLWIQAKI